MVSLTILLVWLILSPAVPSMSSPSKPTSSTPPSPIKAKEVPPPSLSRTTPRSEIYARTPMASSVPALAPTKASTLAAPIKILVEVAVSSFLKANPPERVTRSAIFRSIVPER